MALLSPSVCLRLIINIGKPQFKCPAYYHHFINGEIGSAGIEANNFNFRRRIHTTTILVSQKKYEVKPGIKIQKVVTAEGVVNVKKKVFVPRITLLSSDNSIQVLTLEEAGKIAKRRNLKLVQVTEFDPKTERPTYKLISGADSLDTSIKDKSQRAGQDKKSEKLLNLNSKITDHDLQAKIRHIIKWIEKELTVRVVIAGDHGNLTSAETIYETIAASVKDIGRIVQKISKGGEIKFQIILPKKPKKKPDDPNSEKTENLEEIPPIGK